MIHFAARTGWGCGAANDTDAESVKPSEVTCDACKAWMQGETTVARATLQPELDGLKAKISELEKKTQDQQSKLDSIATICSSQGELIDSLLGERKKLKATIGNLETDRDALGKSLAFFVRQADIGTGRAWKVAPGSDDDQTT